jgi:Ca2+-dependent lipid-binding protein
MTPTVCLTRMQAGRRECAHTKKSTQELQTGVNVEATPARQVDSTPSIIPVHPDDTSDAANAVPRVKSSAQRWRAIMERQEREQKAMEEQRNRRKSRWQQ